MSLRLEVDQRRIAEFCLRNSIRRFAFFGSVLRDDFGPESDVDVLAEFEPGRKPELIALAGMEEELSRILGRNADLRTAEDLSRYFRATQRTSALVCSPEDSVFLGDKVVSTAEVQYAA